MDSDPLAALCAESSGECWAWRPWPLAFGPFLYAASPELARVFFSYVVHLARQQSQNSFGRLIPKPRSFLRSDPCPRWQANTDRDKRWNKSAAVLRPHAVE